MATFDIKGFEEKWRQPKKENIDAARAAALEEGKKYIVVHSTKRRKNVHRGS